MLQPVRLVANAPERFAATSQPLSLIFQAFDCPLTTELEERYVCALHRALVEIQNARFYSQKSQEQEI